MRRLAPALAILLAAVAVFAAVAFPRSGAAEPVALSLPEARALARDAYRRGDVELANALGRGLVQARPDDAAALVIVAATEPLLGRPETGREAGRLAFRAAESDTLRREAAYYTSRAAMAEKRYTAAQFWLRRAYNFAETDAQRDRIADAFEQVRNASPWSYRLSFNVAPNSNINGGASSEFLVIEGDGAPLGSLSPAAQALSGVTASLTFDAAYELFRAPGHRTSLAFRGYRTFNELSQDARDIIEDYEDRLAAIGVEAPEVTGSDFDYGLAQLQLTHRLSRTPWFVPDRYSVSYGQTWYGGEKLDRVMQATISKRFELGQGYSLRLLGEVERRLPDTDAEERTARQLRFDVVRELASGNVVSLSYANTDVISDNPNSEYTGQSLTAGYFMGAPVMGLRVSGQLGWSQRDYPEYILFRYNGNRGDEEVTGSVSVYMENVSYMGFTPVVSVEGRSTTSNISRFEGESLGLSVGIRSAF